MNSPLLTYTFKKWKHPFPRDQKCWVNPSGAGCQPLQIEGEGSSWGTRLLSCTLSSTLFLIPRFLIGEEKGGQSPQRNVSQGTHPLNQNVTLPLLWYIVRNETPTSKEQRHFCKKINCPLGHSNWEANSVGLWREHRACHTMSCVSRGLPTWPQGARFHHRLLWELHEIIHVKHLALYPACNRVRDGFLKCLALYPACNRVRDGFLKCWALLRVTPDSVYLVIFMELSKPG